MKVIFSVSFLFFPFLIFTQCDGDIKPISGSMGYQERGEYCEGFYRSLVSANDIQLIHFTKGKLTYSSTESENIQLSIPVRTVQNVNIRAMGIPRNLFYRMDIILKAAASFKWNTGAVLLRNQRTKYARMLGLLGFTEVNNRRVYVPVQINNGDAGYQIKLVASTRVKQLKWRIRNKTEFKKIRDGRPFSAGQAITISLPDNLPSGEYTLEVLGKENNGVTNISKVVKIKI